MLTSLVERPVSIRPVMILYFHIIGLACEVGLGHHIKPWLSKLRLPLFLECFSNSGGH